MTPIEWIAFFVLLVAVLGYGAAVTLSNGAVTQAIRRLEATYRRQKSLELEELQAQVVERRLQEIKELLAQRDGWRPVLQQVLTDVFPAEASTAAGYDRLTVTDVSATPPSFVVLGPNGTEEWVFTSTLDGMARARGSRVIPLDTSVSLTVRSEIQAVWQNLARQRGLGAGVLPRQTPWYLIRRPHGEKAARLRAGLPQPE